ncbi:MAG: phage late control D family protein, partial [Myxococcales bacterium]
MGHPSAVRLIPDCRVSVDGKKLDTDKDAALTRVEVDLDVDLFGQCVLVFNDPQQKLINGKDFASGVAVKVEIGFSSKLQRVFEGEVVALEPQFRRDLPPSLRVVCQEGLHRLALSQMTRAFNDVDDKEIASKIATEHGLSADAPAGTKEHVLQGNITDAVFLRRLAQKHGNHLRIEGKKLIIGPPPKGAELSIKPGDGLRKVKVRVQTKDQVEEITVHGYDPKTKQEFVGKAKGEGVAGEGTQKYGKGKTLSFAGHEHQPKDQATAEAMAKGRMRKLAEGHVTATLETIGDPGMLPGATLKLEKMGAQIDGSYRVEKALHHFSKHGYFATLKAVRTAKASPPPPPPAAAPAPAPAPSAPPPVVPEDKADAKGGDKKPDAKAPDKKPEDKKPADDKGKPADDKGKPADDKAKPADDKAKPE